MDRGLRRLLTGLLFSGSLLSQPSGLAVSLAAPAPAVLPGPRPESANLRIAELVKQARDLNYEANRHRSRESAERIWSSSTSFALRTMSRTFEVVRAFAMARV